ncbi:2179_t:CDS:1, partial [Dentiscutata heterogama]
KHFQQSNDTSNNGEMVDTNHDNNSSNNRTISPRYHEVDTEI